MNKKYKVEVNIERKKDVYLSVTHNGYQWASISINDPMAEIPLIISALHHYIMSNTRKDVKNMDTMEKALSLKKKLDKILPIGESGQFRTDDSHEEMMEAPEGACDQTDYMGAWDQTDYIAREAIELLIEELRKNNIICPKKTILNRD